MPNPTKRLTVFAVTLAATFLLGSPAGGSDAVGLVNRLTLIPVAPGGPPLDPPCYVPDALPAAGFDVVISDSLRGQAADEYYADRARLAAATFRVLVYRRADYAPVWTGKAGPAAAVIGPDEAGQFRLDRANLPPGGEYVWLVSAQIEAEGGPLLLWSVPLYFRTLPQPDLLPVQLNPDDRQALQAMQALTAQQQRASVAEQTALRGLALYYNFAAASDTFFCTPLDEKAPSPCPDSDTAGWPLPLLLQLGDIGAEALALRRQADAKACDGARLATLGARLGGVAAALAGAGPAAGKPSKELAHFSELGRRLEATPAGPHDAGAQLGELLIVLDSVLGTGTRPPPVLGPASFPGYARGAIHRLEALEEYSPRLSAALPVAEAAGWSAYLRQLRAELTLLAEDASRGRLGNQQLTAELLRVRAIPPPLFPDEWRFVNPANGALDVEKVARIQPQAVEQQRKLIRELYWYRLLQFAAVVVPPPGAG